MLKSVERTDGWNSIYGENGVIHEKPSDEIKDLVPRMQSEGVVTALTGSSQVTP